MAAEPRRWTVFMPDDWGFRLSGPEIPRGSAIEVIEAAPVEAELAELRAENERLQRELAETEDANRYLARMRDEAMFGMAATNRPLIDPPDPGVVERLALYLLNEYRARTDVLAAEPLESLPEFGRQEWCRAATKLLRGVQGGDNASRTDPSEAQGIENEQAFDSEVVGDIPADFDRASRKVRVKLVQRSGVIAVELHTPRQGDHELTVDEATALAGLLSEAARLASRR